MAELRPTEILFTEAQIQQRVAELAVQIRHDHPDDLHVVAVLKGAGNTRVAFRQISDRAHGSIANNIPKSGDPVRKAILDFIATTAPSPAR